MVVVSGYMIATAVVFAIATGLALYSLFEGDNKAPPPPPYRPPPPRRRSRRRSSSRSSSSSDHSSDSKGSRSSGFESSSPKANSDSPKIKTDSGGGLGYYYSKPRSDSSVPYSKSRSSGSDAPRLDGNGSRRPGSVDSNSTKSSSRSGSSSSKSKSRSGSVASSSSISKCESWSITSERHLDENGLPLCLRSESCITCGDEGSGVVTFFPCGGSYLCKKCAFKFLDIGNFCCKCGLEIENVFLKKY